MGAQGARSSLLRLQYSMLRNCTQLLCYDSRQRITLERYDDGYADSGIDRRFCGYMFAPEAFVLWYAALWPFVCGFVS